MGEFWQILFSKEFIPHGHCYLWQPGLVLLHLVSDSLIALAYYSIPVMLVFFVRTRRDVPFNWMFLIFGTFILACGTTHIMDVWMVWYPTYWLSGLIKAITAFFSVLTALELMSLLSKALTLPSRTQLEVTNLDLLKEVVEHKRTEEVLCKVRDELEMRVQERTAELIRINETLSTEITERKQAEEQIQASLVEKEVLLKEIYHRVKNNLQVISSLLNLQSEYIKDTHDLEIFKQSQQRIESMALVHEKLYQSKDLARIDFGEYIRDLVASLFSSYEVNSDAIALTINIGPILLGLDLAIPCGLIINEIVSNSLKHAFPKGKNGEIRLEIVAYNDNQFILIISDNGIGLTPDIDHKKTTTLGLQLVDALTNQLSGKIELNCHNGVNFRITFPAVFKN